MEYPMECPMGLPQVEYYGTPHRNPSIVCHLPFPPPPHPRSCLRRVETRQVDPRPKELFSAMPVAHLLPEQDRETPQTGIYRCPVYKVRPLRRPREGVWDARRSKNNCCGRASRLASLFAPLLLTRAYA